MAGVVELLEVRVVVVGFIIDAFCCRGCRSSELKILRSLREFAEMYHVCIFLIFELASCAMIIVSNLYC